MNIVEKIDKLLVELGISGEMAISSLSLYNKRFGSKQDFAGWIKSAEDKSKSSKKLKKKKDGKLKRLRKKLGL